MAGKGPIVRDCETSVAGPGGGKASGLLDPVKFHPADPNPPVANHSITTLHLSLFMVDSWPCQTRRPLRNYKEISEITEIWKISVAAWRTL